MVIVVSENDRLDPATVERLVREVERPLRARIRELEARQAATFTGSVVDAGGGHVTILVDHNTESYPEPGDLVAVAVAWK